MNSRIALLAAVLLPLSGAPAWALDLGQTEQTLTHRYGEPTSVVQNPTAEKTITYEKPGTLIEIELRQGRCVSVSITKIGEQLSPAEAKRILDENAEGKHWQHEVNSPEVWRRDDGVMAYVNPGFINIVTPDQQKENSGVTAQPAAKNPPAPVSAAPAPAPVAPAAPAAK